MTHHFSVDLTGHELARRAAVMDAIDGTWEPTETLEQEQRAETMLYANLDDHQQQVFNKLRAEGIL